jgi:membrane protein insertase Oxa1/YidC/SpoIIIJ
VGDVSTHLVFALVCVVAITFLLTMRVRLTTHYPDDQSKQMQSMLNFMRGMAIFAGLVLLLVIADLIRIVILA